MDRGDAVLFSLFGLAVGLVVAATADLIDLGQRYSFVIAGILLIIVAVSLTRRS